MTPPNELTGRELDKAVAKAMQPTKFIDAFLSAMEFDPSLLRYSTDPATQAEMLAWLAARTRKGHSFVLRFTPDIGLVGAAFEGRVYDKSESFSAEEALARLVIRVGTCSLCGGDVLRRTVTTYINGIAQQIPTWCSKCGAVPKSPDTIEMQRTKP